MSSSQRGASTIVGRVQSGPMRHFRFMLAIAIGASTLAFTLGVAHSRPAAAQTSCTDTTVTQGAELSASWNAETQDLFCNLADLNGQLVWGVQDIENKTEGEVVQTDQGVSNLSGEWPGNVEELYDDSSNSATAVQSVLQNEYDEGGIGEINWNPPDPITEESAYSDPDENNGWDVCSYIIPDGSNFTQPDPYEAGLPAPAVYFQSELQDLYNELNSLVIPGTSTNLPVLLRSLPEMNGNWFWWGSGGGTSAAGNCTASEYKQLYQYVIGWLSDAETTIADLPEPSQSPVTNAISVWSIAAQTGPGACDSLPQFDSACGIYYAGNKYVDMIGTDAFDPTAGRSMPNSTTVMDNLDATVEFANGKSKMPAMTSGENADPEDATSYWLEYFCALAYDTRCSNESGGNDDLTAIRIATVWDGDYAPSTTNPGTPVSGDFVSALGASYSGLDILMAAQQGSGNPDPWDCANLSC